MILVTGATGTNGMEIIKALSAAGAPCRAMVRNPSKANAIRLPGVEVVEGDLENRTTLSAAMAGIERLLLLSPPVENLDRLESAAIEAAKKAGTRHVVKFSAIGADPSAAFRFGRWHGQSEKNLEASGMAWTHLRPNFFMQNFLGLKAMLAQGSIYQPAENSKASFVDVRDIAAVAAKALTASGHEGKAYTLTGPQALSYDDVAAALGRVMGKPIKYVSLPPQAAKQGMMQSGMPEWLADALNELMDLMRAGGTAGVTNVIRDVTGRAPTTLEQFAKDYRPSLNAA